MILLTFPSIKELNFQCCVIHETLYKRRFICRYYEHLRLSGDIRELGSFNPTLVVCLVIAWVTIFICISRGIKSSGKVW